MTPRATASVQVPYHQVTYTGHVGPTSGDAEVFSSRGKPDTALEILELTWSE